MTRPIRTLLVDDEPLALEGLRVRLRREDDLELVGEAVDGPGAVEAMLRLRPDLVLLDVQMPGFDGFEVLARVASVYLPRVIFVTAYDRYALKAFQVHALDYLLKPVGHRRLQEALRRVRRERDRDGQADAIARLRASLETRAATSVPPDVDATAEPALPRRPATRFTVRDGERFLLVRASEIDWVEGAANYVRLHCGPAVHTLRASMAAMEAQLDPEQFARIHRSTIVNLDRVQDIHPDWHGELAVRLLTGATLRVSRSYRARLLP